MYNFQRLDTTHLNALIQLHKEVRGDAAELELRNFTDEKGTVLPTGYVALREDGSAAAYYGVFPMPLQLEGKTIRAAQSGATMTAPQDQGKGLFTRLAKHTYDDAAREGYAFVFGFPNTQSYPGLVRNLGWSHHRTMTSYFLSAKPPRKLKKYSQLRDMLQTAKARALDVEFLETSCSQADRGRALRDSTFISTKEANTLYIETDSFVVYAKIGGRVFMVGDIVERERGSFSAALETVQELAAISGRPFVSTHQSPGSVLDRHFFGRGYRRQGLPYGHVSFGSIDPDLFDFSWIDYDVF